MMQVLAVINGKSVANVTKVGIMMQFSCSLRRF